MNHGENQLRIDRPEHAVPQSRCGNGTSVIRDLIPYELGGIVELVHSRDGVYSFWNFPDHNLGHSHF